MLHSALSPHRLPSVSSSPRPQGARPEHARVLVLSLGLLLAFGCEGGRSGTTSTSLDPPAGPEPAGEAPAFPFVDHVPQVQITERRILFQELFVLGDELFETQFNTLDGAGALRLPNGDALPSRFSRVPPGGGRFTGPNGQACVGCHNTPFPTSAGEAASNVLQDPARAGVAPFNRRNATSLFASAVPQRVAEEITEDLHQVRDDAAAAALPGGPPVMLPLESKGIRYGSITATRDAFGDVAFDTSGVEGVDPDLVVRPYGWKGNVTTLRDFVRGAARNEMGMEPDELVMKETAGMADPDLDPDGDGVEGELSVGDITAIVIYCGAQPIPTTLDFLVRRRLVPPPSREVAAAIARGGGLFGAIGCADCHIPELHLRDSVFEEPTLRGRGHFADAELDPVETGLDPNRPFRFHLIQEGDFPRLEPHPDGGARVRVFGDLKRHFMGLHLADAQAMPVSDASGRDTGRVVEPGVFLTPELWGAGNSGPWLHDGRAGSLEEAILLHGVDPAPPPGDPARSEAQDARDAFVALSEVDRLAVVEFLRSLVHFALEEGEE